ncbi:MAG: NUDIX domain-containing protein [Christensenellaceae bacterium]|jgi:8-oxo-dGTP pyrophosphatase MutT (NUDIX family)|nr:NUDIX domain-containing protein [Christensenellaceae bacterium]
MAELWDLYDVYGKRTGEVVQRGLEGTAACEGVPEGRYHLVAIVWARTSDGSLLITQRAPEKSFGLSWECPGGAALAGESSLQAALREMKEETGLAPAPENGRLFCRFRRDGERTLFDVWLFRQEIALEDVVLQAGETIGAKLASTEEIRAMIEGGDFLPPERVPYFEALAARLKAGCLAEK